MPRMKLYIEGSAAMLGWPGSASGAVEHRAGAVFCVSTAMLWNISDLFSLGALFLILFWMKILTLNCRAKPIDHQDVIFALGWPCPQLPQSWKFTLKRCYELGRHSAFFFSIYVSTCLYAVCLRESTPDCHLWIYSSSALSMKNRQVALDSAWASFEHKCPCYISRLCSQTVQNAVRLLLRGF